MTKREAREKGLCIDCRKPKDPRSKSRCADCVVRHRLQARKRLHLQDPPRETRPHIL